MFYQSELKIIFYMLLLVVIGNNVVVSRICQMYEVTSRNDKPDLITSKIFGIYKIDYRRICRHRPTYKHVSEDSFIYWNGDKWIIGFSQNDSSCDFVAFSSEVPRRGIWRYWARNSLFTRDMEIKLSCICGAVQLLGENDDKAKIAGTYKPSTEYRCNNRTTYKHITSNNYMHVNKNNRWVISVRKNNQTDVCLNNGFAFNPKRFDDNVPTKTGWRLLGHNTNKWSIVSSMRAICTCNSYRVTASPSTVIAGKNNLTGIYEIYSEKRQCNGKQIYKHTQEKLFIYVDTDNTWMIGSSKELATCKNFAYAYSETSPVGDIPSSSRWKYYNYVRESWCTDSEMTITCF